MIFFDDNTRSGATTELIILLMNLLAYLAERFRSKRQHFDWLLGLYATGRVMP